jgi:hypothetical protein
MLPPFLFLFLYKAISIKCPKGSIYYKPHSIKYELERDAIISQIYEDNKKINNKFNIFDNYADFNYGNYNFKDYDIKYKIVPVVLRHLYGVELGYEIYIKFLVLCIENVGLQNIINTIVDYIIRDYYPINGYNISYQEALNILNYLPINTKNKYFESALFELCHIDYLNNRIKYFDYYNLIEHLEMHDEYIREMHMIYTYLPTEMVNILLPNYSYYDIVSNSDRTIHIYCNHLLNY